MPPENQDHQIGVRLDELLATRGMTLAELSRRVGIAEQNLHILKRGDAKMIRLSTLSALCRELDCEVGDLLYYQGSPLAQGVEQSA